MMTLIRMLFCVMVVCYYEPPDYRADGLTWQTVYGEPEEQVSGVDTGEPLGPPEADVEPPKTPNEEKEVPCFELCKPKSW